jgi:hypothetical protein
MTEHRNNSADELSHALERTRNALTSVGTSGECIDWVLADMQRRLARLPITQSTPEEVLSKLIAHMAKLELELWEAKH